MSLLFVVVVFNRALYLRITCRKWCQSGLETKILASASSICPRPGLGLVNLASKMCYPMQNDFGCIHFVVVSLQHSLQRRGSALYNVGHKFLCSWHCRHVFLFRNIYMWLASTSASISTVRRRLASLALTDMYYACVMFQVLQPRQPRRIIRNHTPYKDDA